MEPRDDGEVDIIVRGLGTMGTGGSATKGIVYKVMSICRHHVTALCSSIRAKA